MCVCGGGGPGVWGGGPRGVTGCGRSRGVGGGGSRGVGGGVRICIKMYKRVIRQYSGLNTIQIMHDKYIYGAHLCNTIIIENNRHW